MCRVLPGETSHGPAAEALLEGAEYDAETEDVAGSSEAAAAEQQKQHKNWVTTQRSNDESPAEVLEKSGGFAWGSHDRPAAEVLLEGEEYGAETEDVAGSSRRTIFSPEWPLTITIAPPKAPSRPQLLSSYRPWHGGVTWGNNAWASGRGTSRRSGVRCRYRICCGVFGCCCGGGNAAAKNSGLGGSGSSGSSGRRANRQRERGGGDDGRG